MAQRMDGMIPPLLHISEVPLHKPVMLALGDRVHLDNRDRHIGRGVVIGVDVHPDPVMVTIVVMYECPDPLDCQCRPDG